MLMSNKAYDICKWVCMVLIPAFNVLLSITCDAWQFNDVPVQAIITTTSAVAAFIGSLVGFSTAEYNKLK